MSWRNDWHPHGWAWHPHDDRGETRARLTDRLKAVQQQRQQVAGEVAEILAGPRWLDNQMARRHHFPTKNFRLNTWPTSGAQKSRASGRLAHVMP
ncbi:hypothetical protein [Amycolatopsis pithecellobii]|uniref:Uncharacterized protein n=1 Tax=Amycolatopsis pithecellobii TaxID=664692 RepID=A0A6N7YLH0_9PSEU|nr:hypothetical protein [Amycolatopsis pithecellobii]MTD53775.1 hypothetical protein [Amycolatopsis pithecellobii]